MKTIIFSHGFGVRADSRGFFPEIASVFDEYLPVMFDYNEVLPNGDTYVAPLYEQAVTFQRIIDENASDETVLICHSQGCIIAGLVNLEKISKVFLLAPPVLASMERVVDRLTKRPGAKYLPDGISTLPRSDGTTSLLPKEYILSLNDVEPLNLYKRVASARPTVIIRATEDEVLGMTNVDEVTKAKLIDVPADHNFTGESRTKLLKALRENI